MKQEWKPEISVDVQERGMVIEFDISGWHHLGVRLTAEGNLLHLHRSPLDGPHREIVLECPAEYDTYAATAEARDGLFLIHLPVNRDRMRMKLQAEWLAEQIRWMIEDLEEDPALLNSPFGLFSNN